MFSKAAIANRNAGTHSLKLPAAGIFVVTLLAILCGGCGRERGHGNVVINGDLSEGAGNSPDYWEAAAGPPELSTLRWHHGPGEPAELEVSNDKPNDAHWNQRLRLAPGWYHFTAELRCEEVPTSNTGATLSILEGWILSDELHGNTGWRAVGFYLRVGGSGAEVELGCRLGGFSSVNTGKAFCRNIKGIKIDSPPAYATRKYDLEQLRAPKTPTALGTPGPTKLEAAMGKRPTATPTQILGERALDSLEWVMAAAVALAAALMTLMFLSGRFTRKPSGTIISFWVIFAIFSTLYAATGSYKRTPFNAHVYLSYAMLHGHFDLIDPPGHFEMIKSAGHSYVAYGVAPSLLMLPFVAICGLDFHQALFSAMLSGLAVSLWWSTLGLLDFDGSDRAWLTALFGVGSLFWFYAGKNGSTWSMMHVTTVLGLMLAIREAVGKGRGWLIGLGFGLAVLARPAALLALPFFVGMLWKNEEELGSSLKRGFWFAVGLGALLLFEAYYNFARFGNPVDNGYKRLILLATNDVDPKTFGLFSLHYVRTNVYLYFSKLPDRLPRFPWFDPDLGGFSILVSTPAMVLALAADYSRRINLLALVAAAAIQGLYLTYYYSGFSQFGCRYSVDYLPFMMLLVAAGAKRLPHWPLILATLAGIVVEMWGIGFWIYKGW